MNPTTFTPNPHRDLKILQYVPGHVPGDVVGYALVGWAIREFGVGTPGASMGAVPVAAGGWITESMYREISPDGQIAGVLDNGRVMTAVHTFDDVGDFYEFGDSEVIRRAPLYAEGHPMQLALGKIKSRRAKRPRKPKLKLVKAAK